MRQPNNSADSTIECIDFSDYRTELTTSKILLHQLFPSTTVARSCSTTAVERLTSTSIRRRPTSTTAVEQLTIRRRPTSTKAAERLTSTTIRRRPTSTTAVERLTLTEERAAFYSKPDHYAAAHAKTRALCRARHHGARQHVELRGTKDLGAAARRTCAAAWNAATQRTARQHGTRQHVELRGSMGRGNT